MGEKPNRLIHEKSPYLLQHAFRLPVCGRPGFEDIITSLHRAWSEKRSDLESFASQLIKEIEKSGQGS